jgi:hypothetical protein
MAIPKMTQQVMDLITKSLNLGQKIEVLYLAKHEFNALVAENEHRLRAPSDDSRCVFMGVEIRVGSIHEIKKRKSSSRP